MVGAGRLDGHLAEDRQVGVRQLQELGLGHEAEDVLEDRQEDEGQRRARMPPDEAHEDPARPAVPRRDAACPDEIEGQDDEDVDRGDDEEARPGGSTSASASVELDAVDRGQPADKAEDEEEVVGLEEIADEQAVEDAKIRVTVFVVRKAKRRTPNWKGKANR